MNTAFIFSSNTRVVWAQTSVGCRHSGRRSVGNLFVILFWFLHKCFLNGLQIEARGSMKTATDINVVVIKVQAFNASSITVLHSRSDGEPSNINVMTMKRIPVLQLFTCIILGLNSGWCLLILYWCSYMNLSWGLCVCVRARVFNQQKELDLDSVIRKRPKILHCNWLWLLDKGKWQTSRQGYF